jgi:DNA-binding NtrC family response regulator
MYDRTLQNVWAAPYRHGTVRKVSSRPVKKQFSLQFRFFKTVSESFYFAAMKAAILVVDDDPSIRDTLGSALQFKGYDVTLASNGQETLKALRAKGFDLVLLDVDVPLTKGWDTLSHLVTTSLSLPLIIITGSPDKQRLDTQDRVTAVLEKPLDLPLLLGVIERALDERSEACGNGTRPEPP